jgi:SAM-dependent methyltransferase
VPIERRLTFGTVAPQYDRFRPSYPGDMVDDVLAFAGAGRGDEVLEVGAGTGKATELFVQRGAVVRAIEPSPGMAAFLRRRWLDAVVSVEETDFETWDPSGVEVALVYSAQAWHWVAPEVRFVKSRSVLPVGGALAVFWTRPRWSHSPLRDQLGEAYRTTVPTFVERPGPMHPAIADEEPERWWEWTRDSAAAGGFSAPESRSYAWPSEYTTDEYVSLIQTHSDHIVLPDDRRAALLAAVASVIDSAGGRITIPYVTRLWLARAR